jgi:hypothetical protein
MELHDELHFGYVRCLAEPFFLNFDGFDSLRNYAGLNIAKHAILNALARRALPRLRSRGISHCQHFIGVLFTGNMREEAAGAALARLEGRCKSDDLVEILLHPGGAAPGEEWIWNGKPSFRNVYYSDWRLRERDTLKSPPFAHSSEIGSSGRQRRTELAQRRWVRRPASVLLDLSTYPTWRTILRENFRFFPRPIAAHPRLSARMIRLFLALVKPCPSSSGNWQKIRIG